MSKNRNREAYSFANINLLGRCNADCFFCLGKDINGLECENQLDEWFDVWKNFHDFLARCAELRINKIYVTGQTADALQYKHLLDLIDFLQMEGFSVGLRTNGFMASSRMVEIHRCRDEIGYSAHTLDSQTQKKIMGVSKIPDWESIIPNSGNNVRVSIVVCEQNMHEVFNLCNYFSGFKNVRYIQLRRISTDTRYEQLKPHIESFEKVYSAFCAFCNPPTMYKKAQVFDWNGKPVVFWRTTETTANSINYFTDGTCSDEYFIVEGYMKENQK